ncbi:DUF3883 domain-containing protein [Candidatus Desulfovibrio trichonymphae]|uniref:DUF3883 domain-containing protein n=1 Tax=Candidatus Desulfovibrio trichonymphae TaxID=1725232 RepID=UPI0018D5986F|nr:DUF3883 domain-containing protein [Candidatus Desulfovibrio trichonymphae]
MLVATIDLLRERNIDVLKRGSVFIDDNDFGMEARLLFYIEDAIQDGVILPNGGKRVISKHIHLVEIKEDGTPLHVGYAPYLDYRAAMADEQASVQSFIGKQTWLQKDVEDLAHGYAIANIIPAHFSEVRTRKEHLIGKTVSLTAEIQYWDFRAADLKQKEAAGKVNARLNSQLAARRAEELAARLQKRLAELETEKLISAMPPVVVGGALVIPRGLLNRLMGTSPADMPETPDTATRQAVEHAAMQSVMDIEKELGFIPRDVSAAKCGYDVESFIPEDRRGEANACLRFIEVKGRAKGADTVTVTKNEILTALNKPEEFIFALVEVDGDKTRTTYLKKPFRAGSKNNYCPGLPQASRRRAHLHSP